MARGLSKDAIVDAAFTVLDNAGIEGLTVRSVAEQLDVRAPALYWHVRDKQELLDEMGTRVWRAVVNRTVLQDHADWRTACAAYVRAARQALLAHRDGARMFSGTYLADPGVLQSQEHGLAWMRDQGFDVPTTTEALGALTAFVVGHCIEEQARIQAPDDRYSLSVRDERVGAAEHPLVAASGRAMLEGDPDTRFDRMLDIVLDGIATRRRP